MALPAGVDGVTVSSGKPLTRFDGTPIEGKLLFTGPDVVTVGGQQVFLGGTTEAKLVGGEFSVELAANDVTGMNPSGWTYRVTAVFSNAPGWVRFIALPKAAPSVTLAQVIVPDPAEANYVPVVGPKGDKGDPGPQGPAGPQPPLGAAGAGDAIALRSTDPTTTNARTPLAHAASHAPGGSDALTGFLPSSGGTVTGVVQTDAVPGTLSASLPSGYGASASPTGLVLGSTYPSDDVVGGTDGTGRLNLYSYQRAGTNSFGETIRNFLMRKDAKAMTAWYGPSSLYDANRDAVPGTWKPWAWTGAHYESNGHTGIHGHWEVEIPDSTGALQGRFEILFADQTTGAIGLDITKIMTNQAHFVVRTSNGQQFRLAAAAGTEKPIVFANDVDGVATRWKIRSNSTAETGSNAGSDFNIARYDDTGTLIDQPLTITRSTGLVTIGGTSGSAAGLLVTRNGGVALTVTPLATGGQGILVTGTDATAQAYSANVTGDPLSRFVVGPDGKHTWGDGTNPRDVELYRSSAQVLKTDHWLSATLGLRINTTSTGGGVGVLAIADATTDPTGTPTGGGVLHSKSGLPWWKGSDGTDYDLAHGQFPVTIVRKTADETVTNSVTVQDDDQLTAAVAASSVYLVEGFILYDGDTTGDFRLTFAGPAGASMDWTPNGLATSQATGTGSMKLDRLPLGTEETLGASGAGVKAVALPRGILTTGSTAGNLTLRWAQAVASATASTVFANSWLRLTKIA
ncbi:hypothetical protein ABZ636_03960 [Streptomyces sp. NPDC007251]|uniref:hypothetical protein n=1 Tax=Streptomyces sp. NPDC007251 TaxID=3154483 RepID=UPI0033C2D69B